MRYFKMIFILTGLFIISCGIEKECDFNQDKCENNKVIICDYAEYNSYWEEYTDCNASNTLCTEKENGSVDCIVPDSDCLNNGNKVCIDEQHIGECIKDGDYFRVKLLETCVEPAICQIDDNGKGYCAVSAE